MFFLEKILKKIEFLLSKSMNLIIKMQSSALTNNYLDYVF